MQPSHLHDDELLYELRIRKNTSSISDRKSRIRAEIALKDRLRSEKTKLELWPRTALEEPEQEIPVIVAKLKELEEILDSTACKNDEIIRNQIYSRFCHIETRLGRLKVPEDSRLANEFTTLKEAIGLARNMYFRAKPKYRPRLDSAFFQDLSNAGFDVTKFENEISASEEEAVSELSDDEVYETIRRPKPRQKTSEPSPRKSFSAKSLPVHKWDVKFDGTREGMVVLDFINRVKFTASSEKVSLRELFHSAYHLFKGDARLWYESNYRECKSWEDLEYKLKEDFLPRGYKRTLEKQILNRKQLAGESFSMYLAHMNTLFEKAERKKDESEKVEILRENMRQIYRDRLGIQLARVREIKDLKDLCLEAENLYPECLGSEVKGGRKEVYEISNNSNPIASGSGSSGNNQRFSCWNCDSEGHLSRNCPQIQSIHCHRCGMKGKTVKTCPKCSKNGGK